MSTFNEVETWLDNVAFSHSRSSQTERYYRYALNLFCKFTGQDPQKILAEYEKSDDRQFKRKYARFLRGFIGYLMREGLTVGSINTYLAAVRSFFKYNDLPLAYIPTSRSKVTFHNRDIEKQEVLEVLSVCVPRDKAFFMVIAQSGLRPITACNLKMKHIEPDFSRGVVPCLIDVPQEIAKGEYHGYFTFIGDDALKSLKAYLNSRSGLGPESYVFTSFGSDKQLNPTSMSNIFKRALRKLKEKGVMNFEVRKGKPSELRLYSLRKYFRNQAYKAGRDFVEFWMGHTLGVDEHYFSREVEHHRKQYAEKAMPFLRIETATPTDTEKIMQNQAEEIKQLKAKLNNYDIIIREQVEDTVEKLRRELYDVPFTKSGFSKPEFRKAVKAMIEEIFEETAMIKELLKEKKAQNHKLS